MEKDEKDAGSRSWNALMSLASFESGYFALNLRSRDCSWRVEGEKATARRRTLCIVFSFRRPEAGAFCALASWPGAPRPSTSAARLC